MSLYFSRATLKRAPDVEALQRLLFPAETGRRADAAHQLVWSLFAGDPAARRDFLFRETTRPGERPTYLILSTRMPCGDARLFDVATKPFEPDLAAGDRLAFDLRVNPTIDAKHPKTGAKGRYDVMTMAVMRLPEHASQTDKAAAVEQAARAWLGRQAMRAGFRILEQTAGTGDMPEAPGFAAAPCETDARPISLAATGFQSSAVPGKRDGRLGLIDFAGVLQVEEPATFLTTLARGFGRAKAYGCGLMLIRRV